VQSTHPTGYRKDTKHAGPLTPGAEVFNELLSAQPETGKKGVLRYMRRIFDNEAPMDTLLKRHWMNPPHSGGFFYTQGYGCFHMLLEWCLATGDSPATRCPPQADRRDGPMALSPTTRFQMDIAHIFADYGLAGMVQLPKLAAKADAVLGEGRRGLFAKYACCLVPPSDLPEPRAGRPGGLR